MTRDPGAQAAAQRKSNVAVAVALLLTLAFFWPTLASFPGAWDQFGMSHGWLVAGVVAWMAWKERGTLLQARDGFPLSLLPLAALSLFWLAATVAHIQLFHQATLVFLLAGWALAVFGRQGVRTAVGSAATFLLALPFWGFLVPALRTMATIVSGSLVRLMGIPVEIEGDVIRIAAGTFVVADSCAGLRFLLAGLTVGAFYALVLVRRWPIQLAIVGLAAVVAIVGNWVRITTLIVIGHVTEMQSGLITSHLGFGWVVFTVGLVPFFLLARAIEVRAAMRAVRQGGARESDGLSPEASHGPPLEASNGPPLEAEEGLESGEMEPGWEGRGEGSGDRGYGRQEGGRGPRLIQRAFVATAVAVVGPALYFAVGAMPSAGFGEGSLEELARGEDWRVAEAQGERPFDWRPSYRGEQEHDRLAFTDGERFVHGDRFVYREQTQGAKLIGFPNEIAPRADIFEERLVGPVDPSGRLWVKQAVVMAPAGPILVWYWYRVGGVDTFSPVHAKVLEVPAFLSRRRASELMALSAVCEPDNCREAFRALAEFMGARFPEAGGGSEASEALVGTEADEPSETGEVREAGESPPA
jgi:exosortase